MLRPAKEGVVYKGPAVDYRGVVRKHELYTGAAESLAALAGEYAFFQPAALYLHGRFTEGLWAEMMAQAGRDVPLFFRRFRWPVFAGLEASGGDGAWNQALFAVQAGDWPTVRDFLRPLLVFDRDTGRLYRPIEQALAMLDPLALDRACGLLRPGAAAVEVTAYGVDSDGFCLAYAIDPATGLAVLRRHPVGADIRRVAQALALGDPQKGLVT